MGACLYFVRKTKRGSKITSRKNKKNIVRNKKPVSILTRKRGDFLHFKNTPLNSSKKTRKKNQKKITKKKNAEVINKKVLVKKDKVSSRKNELKLKERQIKKVLL